MLIHFGADGSEQKTDETESRSLDDTFGRQPSEMSSEDVILLTSPEFEENVKDTATVKVKHAGYDHMGRPLMTTRAPLLSGNGKRVELESNVPLDIEVDSKATEKTTTTNAAGKSGKQGGTGKCMKRDGKRERKGERVTEGRREGEKKGEMGGTDRGWAMHGG